MNTKAILTSTLLTVLFVGTSAMATDDIHRSDFEENVSASESVNKQKVSFQSELDTHYEESFRSSKK